MAFVDNIVLTHFMFLIRRGKRRHYIFKRSHLICGYEFGKQFTTLIQHAVTIQTHHKDVKGVGIRLDQAGMKFGVFTVISSVVVT